MAVPKVVVLVEKLVDDLDHSLVVVLVVVMVDLLVLALAETWAVYLVDSKAAMKVVS